MKVIIKYANRKLYLKNSSQYISMKEVKDMVDNKLPILVTENSTGKDITKDTYKKVANLYSKEGDIDKAINLLKSLK